jgi:hypothetical protein
VCLYIQSFEGNGTISVFLVEANAQEGRHCLRSTGSSSSSR